ncbi:hypothetical protein [Actinocorallia sp. A-T 12471]|uniref:hypothetical protein n=1 Tax=Actinocorallia sp. A-T 12471 TaxID=3089813 RepID=UPI0029D3FA71|nr:hypothetical protein [Actinocorallia sp. A-T 12471]MDX6738995.1 hypothetical protein [Actinocorallia sp. A-T 12471]
MNLRPIGPDDGRRPAVRPRDAAVPSPAAPPTHRAEQLGLGGDMLREDCWSALGPKVRARVEQTAGQTVAWFASVDGSDPDRRPRATVFGESALCVARPRLNAEHKPVYALSSYHLGPIRHLDVDHRPTASAASSRPSGPGSGGGPGAGGAGPSGLSAAARGVLGNLPEKAQTLLQSPFVDGSAVTYCDWYYEGYEHHLEVFVFVLAGAREVTVAAGSKIVPVGHTDATAHWSLRCYRAPVVRRVGA